MNNYKKKIPVKEAKDGLIQKKNRRIKRLEKELAEAKSKLRAYESAFYDVEKFLRESTDEISVEDLIEAAKQDKSLKEVKNDNKKTCKNCLSTNIKTSNLPFGKLYLCEDCGETEVIKNVKDSIQQTSKNENS